MTMSRRLATGLGLFSLALGTAELLVPRRFARAVGAERSPALLVRALGVREIGAGAALLASRRPVGPLWTRVAGDAIDLALLGFTFRSGGRLATTASARGRLLAATIAAAGITALDVAAGAIATAQADPTARSPLAESADVDGRTRTRRSVTVHRPIEEVYAFWRDLENLPRFMRHLESVRALDDRRSVWRAWGPAGRIVEWKAEIVDERPSERLAWRSVEGSDVRNEGVVAFRSATGGRGTVVTAELSYEPPAGLLGARVARLFGEEPTQQVPEDLRRFKQVMETGQVLVSDATRTTTGLKQRAAQPDASAGAREAASAAATTIARPLVATVVGGHDDGKGGE